MEIVEMSGDSKLLDRFYELYRNMFDNEDERESKENLRKYLEMKKGNFYERNAYHVFCSMEGKEISGFLIGDYYSEPNSGVIEFVAIAPEYRKQGIAKNLIDHFTKNMTSDAGREISGIFCEVDIRGLRDSGKPALTSLGFWKNLDFRVVDVNYVQPALSPEKKPVLDLILLYSDMNGGGLQTGELRSFVSSYMKYAMSIEVPDEVQEFKLLESRLAGRTKVTLMPVDEFIESGMSNF